MLLITGPQRARSKINWARAVLELAIALAAVPELETGPVAALELAISLAVVVETSLAPAAAGAAIAWAGADLVAVVAEDVAAEAAEDKQIISMREN